MNISISKFSTLMVLASLTVALALTGCAGVKDSMRLSGKDSAWNPVEKLKAERERDFEPTLPTTMVVTWKGSVYENVGVKTRGFGGRVFFYDDANNAVAADGELTVYGFDDANKKEDASADKKFVFRASEFQSHKSENGLGVSYSFWIPWEKVGGYRKTISLIPIFKTVDGRILKGGQSVNVLHGRTPGKQLSDNGPFKFLGASPAVLGQAGYSEDPESANLGVVPASYEDEVPQQNRIKTSTISMTPNMARRIEASQQTKRSEPEPTVKVEDRSIEQLRQLIAEQRTSNPPTTSNNSEKTQVSTPRPTFGAPGSFR